MGIRTAPNCQAGPGVYCDPDERALIPTVQKVWDFLQAVLEAISEK